jgi:hypothetical protein
MSGTIVEVIGYVGSALVVLSVTRTSILKLRLLGLAGSLGFIVYGFLIDRIPIVLTNLTIAGVHLFFLNQFRSPQRAFFRVLEVDADSRYLRDFIRFYRREIDRFQPQFQFEPAEDQIRVFVLRDMVPAGLLVGRIAGGGRLVVDLDFVIPQYRDLQVARFLYSRSHLFDGRGIHVVESGAGTIDHNRYLERLGFTATGDGRYEMALGRP